MKKEVYIPVKQLRWLKQVKIPVYTPDGEEAIRFNEVRGHLLVPTSKARVLGISPSTIRKRFELNQLTRYTENGMKKLEATNTHTFFDLYEWRDKQFDNQRR